MRSTHQSRDSTCHHDMCVCVTGHGCRFWKMATTFTGLKLQGQLGKFGRTELSDIAGLDDRHSVHHLHITYMSLTLPPSLQIGRAHV